MQAFNAEAAAAAPPVAGRGGEGVRMIPFDFHR